MHRVRFRLPKGRQISFTNFDIIKDSAINMLVAAGANPATLIGPGGCHWGAAPVCRSYTAPAGVRGMAIRTASEIVVSTTDPELSSLLAKADPDRMTKSQSATGESVSMAGSAVIPDEDPVVDPGTEFIEAFALTPILLSRAEDRTLGRWHSDVRDVDISTAVSRRLSKISGRSVKVAVEPDTLYLSGRSSQACRVDIKSNGTKQAVVVGMVFPFTLFGLPEDLRLAWYAGLGERNRLGFGFFGKAA
jgi:CRISPR-associated endoribonuclease Cas6